MDKLRIAYVGVFDLKNYGDHLFPIIFKNEMKKRELNFDMLLFSNFNCIQNFEGEYRINSLNNISSIHQDTPIDCVVIGGGEIFHFYENYHELEIDGSIKVVNYEMLNIWMKPLLFCEQNNIPCIINGVGVPYELGADEVISELLDKCRYISVRNNISKKFLEATMTKQEIFEIPDLAFLVSSLYSDKDLQNARNNLGVTSKYMVFHCGKALPEDAKDKLKKIFISQQKQGLEVVFLPLAYTNGDDFFLNELAREYNISIKTFPKQLSVKEIVSVLAGCEKYIGLSFHGAITAAVFGIVPILYDYYNQLKTKDLFEYMDICELRVTHIDQLEAAIYKQSTIDTGHFSDTIKQLQNCVSKHYDKVKAIICEDNFTDIKKDDGRYKEEYIKELCAHRRGEVKQKQVQAELKEIKRELEEQHKIINDYKLDISNKTQTINDYKMELSNKIELIEKIKKDMESIQYEKYLNDNFRREIEQSKTFRLLRMFDKRFRK